MDNINEIFEKDSKIPFFCKYIVYLLKKVFCVLTVKNNNICVIPYKKVNNRIIINVITKILIKLTKKVILSQKLQNIQTLNKQLYDKGIYVYTGNMLPYYLIYNFIDYISKVRNEETISQEIFILVNNLNDIRKDTIIYISQRFKRINIVTPKIKNLARISNYLESLGIAITVTNNKRKSLSKAKFIINFDFNEDMLNMFNINQNSIIIEMSKQINIKSKLFSGINILDFQMIYDNITNNFNSIDYKAFDKKVLYEQSLEGKKYEDIIKDIQENNIKIVNFIGKNGIIDIQEYKRIDNL